MPTRLYLNRWLTFVASCLMQASAGLSYVFPVYAPALKELWGYHETQIATVGSCFNIGGYLAIPSGALYDRLEKHKRFGPRFVALIGSLLLCTGYLGLYAAASGGIAPSFAFVCICAMVGAGNSSTWFDTASIVTNVRNFPHDRGTVVGILKAFVGLSASIYSSVYAATFASGGASAVNAATTFLFFVCAISPLMTLTLTAFINLVPEAYHEPDPAAPPTPPPQEETTGRRSSRNSSAPSFSAQTRFTFAYCLVAMVAAYQAGTALWAGTVNPSMHARRVLLGGLLGLLALLLAVPLSSGDWVHRKPRPEALERLKRSLLSRLAARGAKAAAKFRRSFTGNGSCGAGISASSEGALTEPLLVPGDGVSGTEGDRHQNPVAAAAATTPAPVSCVGVGAADNAAESSTETKAATGDGKQGTDSTVEPPHVTPAPPVVREGDLEAQLEALEAVPALPDVPLSAALRSPIFWLLMFQFGVGLGTGLSYLNNLGSIVVALGGQPGGQVVFVSLFSVANATGRLAGGVLSELVLRRYGTPRTLLLVGISFLTLLVIGGAAASELSDLYVVSVLAGLAFGAHWSLIPSITSDMFGLTHFGSNYTALQLGPAAGGYLLATVLTGKLYDRAARSHGDQLFCIGADCYFQTWCVLGGLNLVALLGTREMYAQSTKRYRRIVRGGGV
ncbi:hypothetical protein VaNZ11_002750 [Volvox africanus]|uniref:Major facilitator superfamily (MFS) profile domain-containing protein n=1 Tax=Volvox africanus TaxID=51714 RepID=A0ABQ5RSS0_9CHLO|nr:hypothetical protein VaNZ11_002750 [Volvox africanus]